MDDLLRDFEPDVCCALPGYSALEGPHPSRQNRPPTAETTPFPQVPESKIHSCSPCNVKL